MCLIDGLEGIPSMDSLLDVAEPPTPSVAPNGIIREPWYREHAVLQAIDTSTMRARSI
jgi:hypothetical protein